MISNLDELRKQWNNTRQIAQGYTRVDMPHPLECYIGYDGHLNHSLMVISKQKSMVLKSSQSIEVIQYQRSADRLWVLLLNLLNRDQEAVFIDMCYSLLVYSGHGKTEGQAFQLLQERYVQWDRLLQHGNSGLLSIEVQHGLIGELLFLKNQISILHLTAIDAIKGWFGPEYEHQDFLYANIWYEIKTVMEAAQTISISSIEQLSAAGEGQMILLRLCKAVEGTYNSFTLNSLVEDVMRLCSDDEEALLEFNDKLAKIGYLTRPEYDDSVYILKRKVAYQITDDFPRLIREILPVEIVSAKYELSIPAIENWKI